MNEDQLKWLEMFLQARRMMDAAETMLATVKGELERLGITVGEAELALQRASTRRQLRDRRARSRFPKLFDPDDGDSAA